MNVTARRLANQGLSDPRFARPRDVVDWLVAAQAQDYYGVQWGVGLRQAGATDDAVEQALTAGEILRTHVLRPTWHLVTPADIRWLLELTAPHVHRAVAHRYRALGLDEALLWRGHEVMAQALCGGRYLTRAELAAALQASGIGTEGQRLAFLVMHAELEGVICSGPRRGKQFTYALLDERVPEGRRLERDQALAELALRFFASHGPATVHDFAKWSGLRMADARQGLEAAAGGLEQETVGGRHLWFSPSPWAVPDGAPRAYLLSVFDEYFIGYQDRSDLISSELAARLTELGGALQYIVVVDGQVVGTWKRAMGRDEVVVTLDFLAPVTGEQQQAARDAARRYGDFYGLPVTVA